MAAIVPRAELTPVQIRAAGTLVAGTFVVLGTNGVVAQSASTEKVFGVVNNAAVAGDQVTVFIEGVFEVDVTGDLAVGAYGEWASTTGIAALAGTTDFSVGIIVGFDPASGGRARMRLTSVATGGQIAGS